MAGSRQSEEKAAWWEKVIEEAGHSGQSIRQYCREQGVEESQFYWWRRRLQERGTGRRAAAGESDGSGDGGVRFALVSPGAVVEAGGVELILTDGRRLRIGRGVDEQTLRVVLRVVEG